MKTVEIFYFLLVLTIFNSCKEKETASRILQKTINSIDTIETIYYKQDMTRTNPRNINDTIFRYREMYFKRLISDSIVGVKGHWYMYIDDKINIRYEDIFDGKKLIRKNNRDSVARVYDIIKYPNFKKKHFWSHQTLYGMQYEFKYILNNIDSYSIKRLNDTVIENKSCYQIVVRLENKMTMPGFATKLESSKGSVSNVKYLIDKQIFYPIEIKGIIYSTENPEQKFFIEQKYYDIKFNIKIDEDIQFNTLDENLKGFEINEVKPK